MLALGRRRWRRWRRHRHGDPCEATWAVPDVAASAKYAVDLTPPPRPPLPPHTFCRTSALIVCLWQMFLYRWSR